jgi:hypothetical protein
VITESGSTTNSVEPEDRVDKALRKFWMDQQEYASVGEVARHWHHLVLIHPEGTLNTCGNSPSSSYSASASPQFIIQTIPGYRMANV